MKNLLRLSFFLIISACLPFFVVAGGPPQWVEVQSPNFTVYTDAGEKRGREAAMRFEQMRAVFGTLMSNAKVKTAVPLQIIAFRNSKELSQFAPLWKGKPIEVSGLFLGSDDQTYILLDMSAYDPWQVVFHEYGHQLMNGTISALMDPWFNEGFAEYFSSIEVDDQEARVGKIPDSRYEALRGGMMKLPELLKVGKDSKEYNESGDHRSVFYAQSGMLVHYLYDNQIIPKVGTYFDLRIGQNVSVEESVQKAFGMSVVQFDSTLRDYIREGRYKYYKIASPGRIDTKTFQLRAISGSDANAIQAEIHLHTRDYSEKAIGELHEVLKNDPQNAIALRGRGYAYMHKHDYEKAGEYFRQAVKADPKDFRAHYYLALATSRTETLSEPAVLSEITKELEASIALNPDFSDSYMLLAFVQSVSGDPTMAVKTAEKGVALSPRNESHLLTLALMYVSNREPDRALRILRALQHTADPRLSSAIQDGLASAQRIKNWMNERKAEESDSDSDGKTTGQKQD